MGTLPIHDGQTTAAFAELTYQDSDEFGLPTDPASGTPQTSNGAAPTAGDRYGWLGGKQRSADALAGVLLMGARLYHPGTGRFLSVDPMPGGNATAYDYCSADPVNCTDLDGQWGIPKAFKKALKTVAKVSEYASMIPGPIGAAAAGVGAAAYAATGNRKAAARALTAAAAMVGAGAAVKGISLGGASLKAGKARSAFTKAHARVKKIDWKDDRGSIQFSARGVGPSGKPLIHRIRHKSKKDAREAARQQGAGPPLNHPRDRRNSPPHMHPTDRKGNKIEERRPP